MTEDARAALTDIRLFQIALGAESIESINRVGASAAQRVPRRVIDVVADSAIPEPCNPKSNGFMGI